MTRARDRRRAMLVVAVTAVALVGCARGCPSSRPPIHLNPNMDQQPKYKAQSASDFFYDGSTMRAPVFGTVARGELRADERFYTGKEPDGSFVETNPREATPELLDRGEQRYTIYCAPCHDMRGSGQGILQQRAGVSTTSIHEERLLNVADGHLFDVITNGVGLMPSYRWPIAAEDRWAIVAHVRRLQEE